MNCRETKSQLHALIDGELPATLAAQARAHLAECVACRAEAATLRALGAGVAALPRREAPPQFLAAVRAKLEPAAAPTWSDRLFKPFWVKLPLEALAVVGVALLVATVFWRQPVPTAKSETALAAPRAGRAFKAQIELEQAQDSSASAAAKLAPIAAPQLAEANETPALEAEVATVAPRPAMSPPAPTVAGAVREPVLVSADALADVGLDKQLAAAARVEMQAADLATGQERIRRAAAQVGGRVLVVGEAKTQATVELPAGQLAAFRAQLATEPAGRRLREARGAPANGVFALGRAERQSEGLDHAAATAPTVVVEVRIVTPPPTAP